MNGRILMRLLGLATVVLPVGACTLQHNGALGIQHRADGSSGPGKAADAAPVPADPAALPVAVGPSERGLEGLAIAANSPEAAPPVRTDPVRQALSLYGQVPGPVPALPADPGGSDNLRQVTFTTEGADFDPAVDPSGKWIVFASTRHRATSDLYLQKIGGTSVTQLTDDPANDMMPAVSPDGKRIAFCSDRAGNWDIYIMEATGGRAVQLTSDPTHDIRPSFSRDGKKLVYCSYGTQSAQWELVVIDLENPATKRHIGGGLFPHWSPTEDKIVFQKARERGGRWFSVWTIDYVNGEGVRPTAIAVSSNAAAINPQWSPDGKQIVFCTVFQPGGAATEPRQGPGADARPCQADVWVVNADGTNRVNLTRGRFLNTQPTWAADGSVYFVSNRSKDRVDTIWAVRPDLAAGPTEATVKAGPAQGRPPEAHAAAPAPARSAGPPPAPAPATKAPADPGAAEGATAEVRPPDGPP